jgi:hypothetical protein
VSPPGALNAKMRHAKCLMRNEITSNSAAFAEKGLSPKGFVRALVELSSLIPRLCAQSIDRRVS